MRYKNPRVTVDGVVIKDDAILLVKRRKQPFKDKWALPGGFVEYGETTESAIVREILEETGIKTRIRSLIGVYSDPKRDPRGHTITIAYRLDAIDSIDNIRGDDDAADARFFKFDNLPVLAFDHNRIVNDALQKE
ncbi:MAG: NUDIX hydrolase [Candidatus Thermoplasmatota archaeon]